MSRFMPLTDRQAQVLLFVTDFVEHQGYPPTQKQISEKLHLGGVGSYISALRSKGWFKIGPKQRRNLELTKVAQERLDELKEGGLRTL